MKTVLALALTGFAALGTTAAAATLTPQLEEALDRYAPSVDAANLTEEQLQVVQMHVFSSDTAAEKSAKIRAFLN